MLARERNEHEWEAVPDKQPVHLPGIPLSPLAKRTSVDVLR